jgi:hypothetical protein
MGDGSLEDISVIATNNTKDRVPNNKKVRSFKRIPSNSIRIIMVVFTKSIKLYVVWQKELFSFYEEAGRIKLKDIE